MTTAGTQRPRALDWLGLVVVGVSGALAGFVETLLVPFYLGSVIMPIAVVLAIISNVVLPRLARTLVPSTRAAVVPFLTWLIVVVGFGVITRPEGDVILPGGSLQWVSYGLLLGGGVAGVVTIVLSTPPPSRPPRPSGAGTPPAAGPRPGRSRPSRSRPRPKG
jgi:hypothetical protein